MSSSRYVGKLVGSTVAKIDQIVEDPEYQNEEYAFYSVSNKLHVYKVERIFYSSL